MLDFGARVLIGWLANILTSQPIGTRVKHFCFYVKVAYLSYGEYSYERGWFCKCKISSNLRVLIVLINNIVLYITCTIYYILSRYYYLIMEYGAAPASGQHFYLFAACLCNTLPINYQIIIMIILITVKLFHATIDSVHSNLYFRVEMCFTYICAIHYFLNYSVVCV